MTKHRALQADPAGDARDPADPSRLGADEVLAALRVEAASGLSAPEARARLARHGGNALRAAPPVPAWRILAAQFTDSLVLLLLAAALVSAGLWLSERESGLPYDAIAIVAIVLLNAAMGALQQVRADRAVAALRRMAAARARVIRDGALQTVPAADLVPGDILRLEEGDTIPADARLIQVALLQTTEAALTGESLPVFKQVAPLADAADPEPRRTMVFSGTAVTSGRGLAVVTATGMRTEIGRIAQMLQDAPDESTPLQIELDRVGKRLGLVVVAIALVLIATIVVVEEVRSLRALLGVLILGVALAVAAVPEGLPAIVTASLSLGVQRMARRRAIVRRLAAVETLGSAEVIASDKTGTLTRNEMTVRVIATAGGRVDVGGSGYAPVGPLGHAGGALGEALRTEVERALLAGLLASNAVLQERDGRWTVQGDPTEGALIAAARKAGLEAGAVARRFARLAEIPFSSERRLMSTVQSDAEGEAPLLLATKGAPDVVLARCAQEFVGGRGRALTPERRSAIAAANEALAREGLRSLGIAFRALPRDGLGWAAPGGAAPGAEIERDLVFLGLIGMTDPPRAEAREAVARARAAGIRPIMITGDHPGTASAIAAELGIAAGGRALTGAELDALSEEALARTVRDVSVYARVDPAHKLRIVRALRRNGLTVAMTGDGVNDAPALKAADIGVAMGLSGTDVAREAADIVLADDDFATIVAAVEEGRAIFANIRKVLRYLLSSNIGEVATMFLGVVLADALGLTGARAGEVVLPLTATQILWINFVTDGAPALALGVDPADPAAMRRPPRPRGEGVLTRRMWEGIAFVGLVTACSTLVVLDACLPGGFIEGDGTLAYAQTMTFTTLVLSQLFNVLNTRSEDRSAREGLFRNRWLWAAIALSLLLQVAAVSVPVLQRAFSTVSLGVGDWAICAAAASSVLVLGEARKWLIRAAGRRRRTGQR
ncbi:cation-translocating P-type ATPase [Methylobacterium sp. WSM2598]|uniref:cation-translocating P-type ATPase n=1 Tax=Methylobacterium sp. WSM2598 TaxID=398261 RepID=UPI00036E8A4D|nr:cation-translocating P-type ATPase [Methylobacterium sp. WSM2598]